MIVQAFSPSVHVDPLLAKNVLWFFGHPVVYLLLFPAVAVYYHLVPKLAGRPLVAGNVIAIAWAIAVVANVVVWAHHVYIDYPDHSQQATINVLMQPTTFALVIPSALSLYSLGLTIYRSDWRWGVVETTLFLGLFSWLTAGLSGVVNATIAFDKVVHNTLWIVGHFHQMAIVNIGFVIFAAIYYMLPNVYGKPLWSEALGKWHIWLDVHRRHGQLGLLAVAGPERRAAPLCRVAIGLRSIHTRCTALRRADRLRAGALRDQPGADLAWRRTAGGRDAA